MKNYLVPIQKRSFCPISALCEKFYPRNINYMPAVKFFAGLDLDQKTSFLDGHYLKRFPLVFIVTFAVLLHFSGGLAGAKEIRIGAIYPLSGSASETGATIKKAIVFAEKLFNKGHLYNIPVAESFWLPNVDGTVIRIVFADHQGVPEVGVKEAERLIREEGVIALMGCYNSNVTDKVSEVAEREGVVLLSATSTAPQLTRKGFKWFFRTTPHEELFVENIYKFLNDIEARDGVRLEKIAIFNENTIWGSGITNHELQLAEKNGRHIAVALQYPSKIKTMQHEVEMLKSVSPDVVFQASYLDDAILSIKEYTAQNFRPKAIIGMNAGFVSPGFIQELGSKADKLLTRDVWSPEVTGVKPLAKVISQLYSRESKEEFNGNSARAFTGFFVLADALIRSNSRPGRDLRTSLLETDIPEEHIIMPWKGVRFDRETNQNILGQGIIMQIQNRQYHIVWPFELATKGVQW